MITLSTANARQEEEPMRLLIRRIAAVTLVLASSLLAAAQIDIHGPAGSGAFGSAVTALPNGNFVVTDPQANSGVGAVYLYSSNGTLISTLTGSVPGDHVGGPYSTPVVVGSSNFVVISSDWSNGAAAAAGAVTFVNGTTGLNGVVSPANSLVGTTTDDQVGGYGVTVLANGNYVVASMYWNNGGADTEYGAATWGSGTAGVSGPVSASNSLVGTTPYDNVGYDGIIALPNGNYVVIVADWGGNGTTDAAYGAVTWANGATGITGVISATNSLVGTTAGDRVGDEGVTVLSNGNYVVCSARWNNGVASSNFGAATWGNGATGVKGAVSSSNSLIGTTAGDAVGSWAATALSNGNYVIDSPGWNNGVANNHVGAATWANGAGGIAGAVSASNSLIGSHPGDAVAYYPTLALANGNYVVRSENWNGALGAATWGNGATGETGVVSAGNSLVGSSANDHVGSRVTALTNGNYVVGSPQWQGNIGAATWGNGATGTTGVVSAANSLVGTTAAGVGGGDRIGYAGITALDDGNYVVVSPLWRNGDTGNYAYYGAVTWGDGSSGTSGTVSAANSLHGTDAGDRVGEYGALALPSGRFVVTSPTWNIANRLGAATWAGHTTIGAVSANNSLVGSTTNDNIGVNYGTVVFSDGNYLVHSPLWNNGSLSQAGAVTLASGRFRLKGPIQSWNSVLGTTAGGGMYMSSDYDPARHRLIVGRPYDNIATLFTMDQIFAGDFEP
jgi:hypothetical protein